MTHQYTMGPLPRINHPARTLTTTSTSENPQPETPKKEELAKTTIARGWRDRKNREEFYSALTALQGLAVISGVGLYFLKEIKEREKRKAELGRSITKDIENVKTKLKFLINELDDLKRRTDSWKNLNKGDIDAHVNLEKINKYEETFSFSMRMVSRYDTSLVPQVLQIEADYQNERFRRMTEVLLQERGDIEKTKQNLESLRKCFMDVYNVLNVVGLATGANTIEKNKQSDEQRLLLKTLETNKQNTSDGKGGIITDEIRVVLHQFRREQLETLKAQKLERNVDNSQLVRDQVFKTGGAGPK